MQNPSNGTRRAETRKIEPFVSSIIPPTSASKQDKTSRSPRKSLPPHLDRLIDLPWTSDRSRQVDQWLWYTEQEFETVGGGDE